MKKSDKMSTQAMVSCAMLCAVAYALTFISHYVMPAMIPAAPWLKYDPKDIVIALGGLLFGAAPAVMMSVVVALIEMVTISETGWIGAAMNIIATCAFVLPTTLIYRKNRTLSSAVAGLICGVAAMIIAMLLWNYLLTPIYMGWPRSAVAELLIPAFLPFNAVKGLLNMAATLLLYKPVMAALRAAHLMPKGAGASQNSKKNTVFSVVIAAAAVAVCAVILLLLNRVI